MLTHPYLARHRCACRAAYHVTLGFGQARRPGSYNLQQVQARHRRRQAAWPSTESIAQILAATSTTLDDFVALVNDRQGPRSRPVPLIGMAQAGAEGFFDDAGFPAGGGWEKSPFPNWPTNIAMPWRSPGDSMLPVYRDGDRIMVSPSGNLRRGDRVVVKTHAGGSDGQTAAPHHRATQSNREELQSRFRGSRFCSVRDRIRAQDYLGELQ